MSNKICLSVMILLIATSLRSAEVSADVRSAETQAVEVGPRGILASSLGALLTSDLLNGGGADDTAVLQRALDRAKDGGGVHLIIDGPALVSGLDVYSDTTIECTAGGGLYLKSESNRAIVRNGNRSKEGLLDRGISIRNCFFNGNSDGQPVVGPIDSFFRAAQERDGTFISGLQFFGVQHLSVENVVLWNIRSFGMWVANAKFVRLRDVTVDVGIPIYPEGQGLEAVQKWIKKYSHNQDGVHFCGPIQYLTIDGLLLRTMDDGLSLTADDLPAAKEGAMGPFVGGGAITDVTVNNVVFMGASHAIRLLSATSRMDRIVISNLSGTARERMAVISPFLLRGGGNFGSILFSNVAVDLLDSYPRSEAYALLNEEISQDSLEAAATWNWNVGAHSSADLGEETDLPLFSINGRIENLQLRQVVTKGISGRPLIRVGKYAAIESLVADLSIHDPKGQALPIRLLGNITRLNLLLDWQGKQPIEHGGGRIGTLRGIETGAHDCGTNQSGLRAC